MEIERKFLIPNPPADLEQYPSAIIEQGYLALTSEGVELRVRRKGSDCYLTVKHGGGLSRVEVELPLPVHQFEELWPLTEGRRLQKTRFDLPGPAGLKFELDVYSGSLTGLRTVDVEFSDEAEARSFEPPEWFGREIGGDPNFRNERLSRCGLPAEMA